MKIKFLRLVFILSCILFVFHEPLGLEPHHQNQISDFSIEEVSQQVGLHFTHEQTNFSFYKNIEPWLSSLSSSVAVVDIDLDGWPDIYLNTGAVNKMNKLFRNNHDGTFTDVAAKYGLDDVNHNNFSVRSVFFDSDNDGTPELLLLKSGRKAFYKKSADGKYQEIPFPDQEDSGFYANAVQVLDINRDGLLDIIISGTVGRAEGRSAPLPTNFVHSANGAPTYVYENKGNNIFVLNTEWLKEKPMAFTNALGVGDLANHHKSDLWFATDYNEDQILLQEDGYNGYHRSQEIKKNVGAKSGMSAEVAYLDSDFPYVFVTQVYKPSYMPFGNILWKYDGEGFVDHAGDFGINRCGWAWGAKFIDLNNSGQLSLYVANGFIAGEDPQKSYWYKIGVLSAGLQGVVSSPKYWPDMKGQDLSGHEKDCLFVNEGDNKFYDYAEDPEFNIDRDKLLGRGVAVIDYLNNGSQALTVSNQKGRAYLYKVTHHNENHWIGFKLIGTKSNRDAIGAKIELWSGSKKMIRELYPLNGYSSQSDSRLHFGLGPVKRVDKIKIYWPSGKVQEIISGLETNQYHEIKEEI